MTERQTRKTRWLAPAPGWMIYPSPVETWAVVAVEILDHSVEALCLGKKQSISFNTQQHTMLGHDRSRVIDH